MKKPLLKVKCYAGYKGFQYPSSFIFKQKHFEIVQIIDTYYEQRPVPTQDESLIFKVKCKQGAVATLALSQKDLSWTLRDLKIPD
jgi:hypothetical protein